MCQHFIIHAISVYAYVKYSKRNTECEKEIDTIAWKIALIAKSCKLYVLWRQCVCCVQEEERKKKHYILAAVKDADVATEW